MRMTIGTSQAKKSIYEYTLRPTTMSLPRYSPWSILILLLLVTIQSRSQLLRSSLHNTSPISEPRPEQHIRICEQPFFKRDDDELGAFEPGAEELTYVLGMREI